ncbi:hypothetical protein AN958_08392 [Leucoagaricus sp. SymC.cos]|nr:hypothetical protein AN958_08392 [Leucoagaricus sp. SymC.cos]
MIDGTDAHDRKCKCLQSLCGPWQLTSGRVAMELLANNVIPGAEFDASERYPPPSCHPETRLDISRRLTSWIHNPSREKNLQWLHGPAGVGKSAIMQTLAECEAEGSSSILGATLFFSRRDQRCNSQRVFVTLAYQLAVKYPPYRRYVVNLLANDPRVVHKSLTEQFKWLFIRPFVQDDVFRGNCRTILILLDGLDECEGEAAQRELIILLGRFTAQNPTISLIWIIASRLEPHTQNAFAHPHVKNSYLSVGVPIDSSQSCADVEHYLRDKFDDIRQTYAVCFPPTMHSWPAESDFLRIVARACGLFVFASSVIRFVEDEYIGDPASQLQAVLRAIQTSPLSGVCLNPFSALDALYTEILSSIPLQILPKTKDLLAFALVRYAPFGVACNWLGMTQADAYSALRKLQSLLNIPPSEVVSQLAHLEVFHTSFIDYLLSPSRSGVFSIDDQHSWEILFQAITRVLVQCYNPGK